MVCRGVHGVWVERCDGEVHGVCDGEVCGGECMVCRCVEGGAWCVGGEV